jgi:1-acyl-sn-glycerol-3-phosphate acyltransferase
MASSPARTSPLAKRALWAGLPPVIRTVARVAWRLEVDPGPGLPDAPFVVASNHHSFLDPLLVGSVLREKIRFLGLVDLFGYYRSLDYALEVFDVIPLQRGVVPLGPVRTALSHLEQGGAVGLFPEGTRHWDFDPERALPGAAWLAARAGVPLVPVAVSGTERVLGVDNRLRRGRVIVEVGPPLSAVSGRRAAVDDLTVRWATWVSHALSRKTPN